MFEEVGGDPTAISMVKRVVVGVCADIYDDQSEMVDGQQLAPAKPKSPFVVSSRTDHD